MSSVLTELSYIVLANSSTFQELHDPFALALHHTQCLLLFIGSCIELLMYKPNPSKLPPQHYAWEILAVLICMMNGDTDKSYTLKTMWRLSVQGKEMEHSLFSTG